MVEQHKRKVGHADSSRSQKKVKSAVVEEPLSSSAQKRQLKKERQSHRRHADSVTEAKNLWNKLRLKSNTAKDTAKLMDDVMVLIEGKVTEIALQHDASRVIQAAIQFGNEEQRKLLLKEICQESATGLAEMAKIQYAHFCCLKFIKYCVRDEECVKLIVKAFKGSIPKLAVHSVGARVVESLFLIFPTKATLSLKQELYGPHFSLFSHELKTTPTLKGNLDSAKTETQKEAALSFVRDILLKGMTKSFYGYTFFQELLAEYLDVVDSSEIRSFASIAVDHSIHLLSTRPGARAVATFASYGTPKDRKRICKSLKGYTSSSLLHRDAYLALIRLIQVTDDTVSINKSVLSEIINPPMDGDTENSTLFDLATSESASKLFLMLLVDNDENRMKYFDPYERTILETDVAVIENGKEIKTSKKDPSLRRQELLKYMKASLEDMCAQNAFRLLVSLPGSRVIKEFCNSFASDRVIDAILEACESTLAKEESLFEDPVGHRVIKNLILCDADREEPLFSNKFFEIFSDRLLEVASSNRGAFVVAALVKVPSLKTKTLEKVRAMKKTLKQHSKSGGATAGFEALLKTIN